MKIYTAKYKDIPAVAIETKKLYSRFLPEQGAKLASLIHIETGAELLAQAAGEQYLPLDMSTPYVESECSAFDDMFPCIDPQDERYPCHGEVCRRPHCWSVEGETLRMCFESALLPYSFEKSVSESADGGLVIAYRIENKSSNPLDCLWAGHIMLAACEGGKVCVPFDEGAGVEFTFDEFGEFGKPGTPNRLTTEMLTQEKYGPEKGNAYKFYFTDRLPGGTLSYSRPDIGKSVAVRVDSDKVPYLGIWMNNGCFKGMYNAALEPCTAPFDNPKKAKARGYDCSIAPGGCMEFTLEFEVR